MHNFTSSDLYGKFHNTDAWEKVFECMHDNSEACRFDYKLKDTKFLLNGKKVASVTKTVAYNQHGKDISDNCMHVKFADDPEGTLCIESRETVDLLYPDIRRETVMNKITISGTRYSISALKRFSFVGEPEVKNLETTIDTPEFKHYTLRATNLIAHYDCNVKNITWIESTKGLIHEMIIEVATKAKEHQHIILVSKAPFVYEYSDTAECPVCTEEVELLILQCDATKNQKVRHKLCDACWYKINGQSKQGSVQCPFCRSSCVPKTVVL